MKIQVGKRYLRADGGITGVICDNRGNKNFPFRDGKFLGYAYTEKGTYWDNDTSEVDLIAEVPEHLLEKLVRDILEFNGLNPVTPFEDMDNKEVKQRCTDYFNNNESIKE